MAGPEFKFISCSEYSNGPDSPLTGYVIPWVFVSIMRAYKDQQYVDVKAYSLDTWYKCTWQHPNDFNNWKPFCTGCEPTNSIGKP
ncbi:uncharacterized protein PGTG_05798 [Puccinia graminis f. sp. tritici CRL 75-36-700-3]|uniref:Uncharacterized protein n=1 Tax=Puccinia graminis f. sp. tritici (strain CRL 75-36-700-3 / race SCCL) TaxID=418459 RepID=E3K5M0_PUCGT|nr:uncharacterized protein PGTG_05798 [Puccinia graminis f. sp. tritici CRL 75-36-700-3]EFP79477.2 hypothetical protein PGTG_05798 [Puccinia graminis f. sp. tritici CRL 75-36-700-3]